MTRTELLAACARGELFNTEMVRAILDDRKNRTMRLVKGKRDADHGGGPSRTWMFSNIKQLAPDMWFGIDHLSSGPFVNDPVSPKHKVGDIIYVRETWCFLDGNDLREAGVPPCYAYSSYQYKADNDGTESCPVFEGWRPSIHMPKSAARIFLRITGVRGQRPHELTESEAGQEGFHHDVAKFTNKDRFRDYWDSLCAKKDLPLYGYDANPWCWVYEFERVVPE